MAYQLVSSVMGTAIPIISGPGAIGMTIALAAQNQSGWDDLGSLIGIGLLGAILYLCLALGEPVVKMLGKSGLTAFNQVLGFFILAIALQLVTDGIFVLFRSLG
jgi:multiple antibiotic resistance protein